MGTSRRGFLQSIAAGSAMAVVHAPAASAEEKTRFEFSTDVVVVGLGAAGAATAITAADKGAQVLVIERLNQSAAPEAILIFYGRVRRCRPGERASYLSESTLHRCQERRFICVDRFRLVGAPHFLSRFLAAKVENSRTVGRGRVLQAGENAIGVKLAVLD